MYSEMEYTALGCIVLVCFIVGFIVAASFIYDIIMLLLK